MYEVFLTAHVEDSDFSAACAILSGLSGMSPWESFHRNLLFQGPPKPAGISNQSSIDKPIRKEVGLLWKDLHQNLTRQSFILQVRYEVLKDRYLDPTAPPMDFDATPGILRWTDFPDPPKGRPVLIQRKKVELWDQKKLPSVMRDNLFQLKGETIEEMYRFFREDTEFCLVRQYYPKEYSINQGAPGSESLVPVDTQRRWFLFVKGHILQDNKPDEIRKIQDQLLGIRTELEGVFEFKNIDRKVFDTRIAQQPQGIQTLPQKMTLGRN
ncbi:mediator complex, subunit Med18 [Thelonectria olida]|uniref:Mediator of RNA polymerase II transcription subunit 18 n=1 Tax=Thelonectria olida TaxID=1576542 RepID=A0A9P8VSG5_9HYPO|nr:mediator complex, subunit Med18 [Thelonectria olida]